MKTLFFPAISFLLPLLTALPALASDFETGSEKIITQPVKEDLYISGGTITVNAQIGGDLVAAGGTIRLNDSVRGDALLAGGTLLINEYIGDDIRAGGGKIRIEKNVQGDVIVAGGEVVISPGVTIFGDLISMGGKTVLNGTVKGRAKMMGGEIYLNGKVERELEVKGGKLIVNGQVLGKSTLAARDIVIQNRARFYQDVEYWQESGPVNFDQAMVTGRASFSPGLQIDTGNSNWYYLGFGSALWLFVYLASVLLLLFLLQYIFTKQLAQAGEMFNDNKFRIFGYGVAYFAGLPLASILLIISIIGMPIGLFALFFYLFSLALAYVIMALVVANWYALAYRTGWNKQSIVWAALAILVFFKLVAMIPFAGWLVSLVLVGTSFGAIIGSLHRKEEPVLVAST